MLKKEQSVYLLAGSEQFLKERNIAQIKTKFLDKEYGDFNFNIFYAGSASAQRILECANTAPFLGRKRVVLVRQIENFSSAEEEILLSYLKTPHKQTILILETAQSNLQQSFFRQICKYARLIFCHSPQGNQLFVWIKSRLDSQGKKIEKKALQLLLENVSNNLQLLASYLDNLILYIGKRKLIELDDVEKLVGPDVTVSAFLLFDAVAAGDRNKAFQILDSLLKESVSSVQILGALSHKFISEKNNMNPTFFMRSLEDLQNADSDIKSGRQNPKTALVLLLVRLLHLKKFS
jgi:DNA polymerase-3 subunit delta